MLKNIAIYSVAILLIFATGGFTVFQHYCSCKEIIITSVLKETACLYEGNGAESCCQDGSMVKDCGSDKTDDPSHNRNRDHANDCCQERMNFFKTADGFTPGKQDLKTFTLLLMYSNLTVIVNDDSPVAQSFALSETTSLFTFPREFLIAHQRKDSPEIA